MSMRRRQFLAATSAACMLPGAALAGSESVSVLLDWFVNPNHAPLIIAEQIGAFARRGLAVTLVQPADPTMPPRLIAAGHADMAVSYQATLYREVLGGLPLARIGALEDRSLSALCAIKGRGVEKLSDLKGKRIGYNEVGGDVVLACIDKMFRTAGFSIGDVNLVNVGTALTTSLLTARVDAVTILKNFEAFEIEDKGQTPLMFDFEAYGVPKSDALIYIVQKERAREPRFERLLDAVKEGTAYIRQHPAEAWGLFLKAYPDLDNDLNHRAWTYTTPYFPADPAALDAEKYTSFARFLTERKVLTSAPDIATYAVDLDKQPA